MLGLRTSRNLNHVHRRVDLRLWILIKEFTIAVVAVRLLYSFMDLKIVYKLINWLAVQLSTSYIKVTTTSLYCYVVYIFIRVNIVILLYIVYKVGILLLKSHLRIKVHWLKLIFNQFLALLLINLEVRLLFLPNRWCSQTHLLLCFTFFHYCSSGIQPALPLVKTAKIWSEIIDC